jgi:hypothetical protein
MSSMLKKKIALVRELHQKKEKRIEEEKLFKIKILNAIDLKLSSPKQQFSTFRQKSQSPKSPSKGSTSCKNIMKNYCRALTNFALSRIALHYLIPMLELHQIKLEDFQEFIEERKEKVNCIKNLREMLLIEDDDCDHTALLKNIFKEISIVFLKNFSVNWIFNSKICDKRVHLKYRFKILRRVQHPIYFTYLEDFQAKGLSF